MGLHRPSKPEEEGGISWRIYCHTYLCASLDHMLGLGQPELLSHSGFTIIDRSEYIPLLWFSDDNTSRNLLSLMTFHSICQGCNPKHWKWQLNNVSSLCKGCQSSKSSDKSSCCLYQQTGSRVCLARDWGVTLEAGSSCVQLMIRIRSGKLKAISAGLSTKLQ